MSIMPEVDDTDLLIPIFIKSFVSACTILLLLDLFLQLNKYIPCSEWNGTLFSLPLLALIGLSNPVYTVHACMNVINRSDELKYGFSFSRSGVVLTSLESFTWTSVLHCVADCVLHFRKNYEAWDIHTFSGKRFSGLHFCVLNFNSICRPVFIRHITEITICNIRILCLHNNVTIIRQD